MKSFRKRLHFGNGYSRETTSLRKVLPSRNDFPPESTSLWKRLPRQLLSPVRDRLLEDLFFYNNKSSNNQNYNWTATTDSEIHQGYKSHHSNNSSSLGGTRQPSKDSNHSSTHANPPLINGQPSLLNTNPV